MRLQNLEDQNAELIDKNTTLQDEQMKANNFKPLLESYKTQVSELDSKVVNLQKLLDKANFDAEQTTKKLATSEAARNSDREELELYQERVRELELGAVKASGDHDRPPSPSSTTGKTPQDEGGGDQILDEELEDALSGSSVTNLKLQLKRLRRERDAAVANKADVSRIMVLENLLEDAQRMKDRYESDYLREHQENLVISHQMEEIRSGKSSVGDG